MNNLSNNHQTAELDLTSRIESLIKELRTTHPEHIKFLDTCHAPLINLILKQYKGLSKSSEDSHPTAEMIYLAAPTGAGKDTLVRRIMKENPDTYYAVLNMDMFRHYHNKIIGATDRIPDKHYASTTNQTSYEIYFLIQELILREFPGTNVIITGTMRNLDWVKEIASRYQSDPNTNYQTTLVALAVPRIQSAFSIFERYIEKVNSAKDSSSKSEPINLNSLDTSTPNDNKEETDHPLRYTSLQYHDNTIKVFADNVRSAEEELRANPQTSSFGRIKVHKRAVDVLDINENTLLYDSSNPGYHTAYSKVRNTINSITQIPPERIQRLLDMIEANKQYLIKQDLYQIILDGIHLIQNELSQQSKDDDAR